MNDMIDRETQATGLVDAYRMVVVGLVIIIACFSNARAQSIDGWTHVGQVGAAKFVTLDRESTVSPLGWAKLIAQSEYRQGATLL